MPNGRVFRNQRPRGASDFFSLPFKTPCIGAKERADPTEGQWERGGASPCLKGWRGGMLSFHVDKAEKGALRGGLESKKRALVFPKV